MLRLVTIQSFYTDYFTSCYNTKLLHWLFYTLLQHKVVTWIIFHLVTTQSCYTSYMTSCHNTELLFWLCYTLLQHKAVRMVILHLLTLVI